MTLQANVARRHLVTALAQRFHVYTSCVHGGFAGCQFSKAWRLQC